MTKLLELEEGRATKIEEADKESPVRLQSEAPLLINNGQLAEEKIVESDPHPCSKHPTTYLETMINLVKGNIGAGMFAMGDAFKNAGLIAGPILTIFLGIICVYGNHILVNACNTVQIRRKLAQPPNFGNTVQFCFEEGPKRMRAWARSARIITFVFIVLTQLGFCSVYFIFISNTCNKILQPYGIHIDVHIYMAMILIPIILTSLVKNLKFLTPFSLIANICLCSGVVLTLYLSCTDLPSFSERKAMADWSQLPLFFGTTVYSFEGISMVLPLKNEMKNQKRFASPLGALNSGMSVVCGILVSIGFVGYLKYGDKVEGSLTLNLPQNVFAELVQVMICIGILLSYTLQCYVIIVIIWPIIKTKYGPFKHPVLGEELLRVVVVLTTFTLAECVPNLALFISLLGTFCGTTLALILPPVCDLVVRWPSDFGCCKWRLLLDILLLVVAAIGFAAGGYCSIKEIIQHYT